MTLPAPILPDVLVPGLRVVFCGTASARAGAYYAGPGNRFWATLHEVGLTPELLAPAEFARLPEFGIGLTDVSKTASGSDLEVGRRGIDPERLDAAIAAVSPAHLAFTSKHSAELVLGRRVDHGPQSERIGGTETWVCRRLPAALADIGTSPVAGPRRRRALTAPRRAQAEQGPSGPFRAGRLSDGGAEIRTRIRGR
jgi:double-stranded uracil-DNA glycosylase